MRDSACVEVMTTLHGSALSVWRRVGGCILLKGVIGFSRDPLKSTPTPHVWALNPFIKIHFSHVGASESLWGYFSHSMDLVLIFLVSSWVCSKISASLCISWTIICHVALDSLFRLLSLTCFLSKALVSLTFLS